MRDAGELSIALQALRQRAAELDEAPPRDAEPVERLGIRAYARHRKARGLPGASHTAVGKAIKDGRIADAVSDDGLIDPDHADRLWAARTRTTVETAATSEAEDVPTEPSEPEDDTSASSVLYHKARARLVAAQAAEKELDLAERQDRIIPVEIYERRWAGFLGALRRGVDGIPPNWAPPLAACSGEVEEIQLELKRLTRELLTSLLEETTESAAGVD